MTSYPLLIPIHAISIFEGEVCHLARGTKWNLETCLSCHVGHLCIHLYGWINVEKVERITFGCY